jgi:muramoyltetrapeptide carboxypeptidase
VLGAVSDWKPSPMDRGYNLKSMVEHIRSVTKTPVLTGLPFGHVCTKVTMPFGRAVTLLVDQRDALIGW